MASETCDNCIWGLYKDVGYSNWTVEGTNFYCRMRNRPVTSAETYEEIEKPDDCNDWKWGEPPKLSVEDRLPDDCKETSYEGW